MPNLKIRALVTVLAVAVGLGMLLLAGCGGSDNSVNKPKDMTGTCESCHQDQELLQATADPVEDNGGEGTGEG